MAFGALIMPERVSILRPVAPGAFDQLVPAFQRIISFRVIEAAHSFDDMKGFFRMALPAILTETVIVYIGMATGAVAERNASENLERGSVPCLDPVALYAFNIPVLPIQAEPCIRMIESGSRLEFAEAMAVGAAR